MAVRQYVGARYVPKFADPVAWQSGTSYEALTIVTYNNSSYTSKIPVPATVGNPADNDEYWALTGNYNAQVEAYREETVAVQENLNEEIVNRENAITAETETRENADTALGERITGIDNELTEKINTLALQTRTRNYLFIGDSYGVISNNWTTLISQWYTGHCYFNCVSGTGFAYPTTQTGFYQNLQNAVIADKKSITDIVFVGGINDAIPTVNLSDIEIGMNLIDTYIKNNYPNAEVSVGFFGWQTSNSTDQFKRTNQNINNTINAIKAGCASHKWRFYTNSEYVMHFYKWFTDGDGLHPNASGERSLADQLSLALQNGTCDVHYEVSNTVNVKLIADESIEHNLFDLIKLDNSVFTATSNGTWFQLINIANPSAVYDLATFDGVSPFMSCDQYVVCSGKVRTLIAADGTDYTLPLSIDFKDNGVQLYSMVQKTTEPITNLTGFWLDYFKVIANTANT